MHKIPAFLFSLFPPSDPFLLQSLQSFKYYVFWLTMDERRGCPFPCASLSDYIHLPACIRLRWLWQCGTEPAPVRWISLMVPWGIIRSQWVSVTDCCPCCADSPLLVINGELQWQSEGHGDLLLFLKYLQYKLNVWINQYFDKERMRARDLTPVLKVYSGFIFPFIHA